MGDHKRIKHSLNTSQGADANNVWHSTAIGDLGSLESPGLSTANSPRKRPAPKSPIIITEPSGHFYFSFVLQKNGYFIGLPRNRTQVDAMIFRKNLTEWIEERSKGDSEARAEPPKFINDMKRYLTLTENLKHSMKPTLHAEEIYQPSLLHCLLGVMPLQLEVISIILPALTDVAYMCRDVEDVTYLNMILNQIKWLPDLADAATLADDILDILVRANEKAQKEMIRYLPDIIPEKFHFKIADKLLKLLEEFSPLCSTLMECFSVIDISEQRLTKIRISAVENLPLLEPKDYPAFFAFLFRADDSDILFNVITDLREKFKFEISGTDTSTGATVGDIVDKIRFCISVNEKIVPVWIKQIKDEFSDGSPLLLSIDLVMLLIFLENYKAVESPLKLVLGNENDSLTLVDEVIKNCPTIIDPVFTNFAKFLERMLWSTKDSKSYSVTTKILIKLFSATNDYNAQQVIVTFTSVLAHGNIACRDYVIDALSLLAQKDTLKLLKFMPLIMGIMDYVIKFSPAQVRKVMTVLAAAAYIPNNRESLRFEAEFVILMRKQVTHTNVQIKCVGVIGSVATIDQLIKQKTEESKISNLVEYVWTQVQRHEEACWIFFDEMTTVINSRNVPINIMEELKSTLSLKFSESWTIPENKVSGSDTFGSSKLKLELVMNANSEIADDPTAIKFESLTMGLSPLVIAAHARLLCALASKTADGSLEEVDIILGCPLLLPPMPSYISSQLLKTYTVTQKSDMGGYLVLAINFLREVVSAFCTQTDTEIKIKIWMRLRDLVTLQKLLVTFITESPSLMSTLPYAYALETVRTYHIPGMGERKRSDKKGDKKGKKKAQKAPKDDDDESEDDMPGPSSKALQSSKAGKGSKTRSRKTAASRANVSDYKDFGDEIHPNSFVPNFRRFDTNVFLMLNARFLVKAPGINYDQLLVGVSSSQAPQQLVQTAEFLTPQTLVLLLRDLNHQVENSHICIIENVALGFGKDFFECLCELLAILFRACVKEKMSSELRKEVDASFQYLYCTLSHYMEKVAKVSEYKHYFEKALKTMAQRGGEIQSEYMHEEKIANFLSGFSDSIQNPSSAVEHLKFMKTVHSCGGPDLQGFISVKIDCNAASYLKREWKLPSATIQLILKMWFTTSENTLDVLSQLTNDLMSEELDKIPSTEVYQSCSAANFHVWYRVIIETLAQYVMKNTKKIDDGVDELVARWTYAFEILKTLVSVIQQNRKAVIITQLLKNTRIFLEAFINNGIKLLPLLWRSHTKEAKLLIKTLQVPARKIQYVCEHCKVEKNASLMRHVPLVKRALETLLFRIREVVASRDASAFWMGSLRHRNLDGENIASQFASEPEFDEESDEEESDADENNEDLFELNDVPGDFEEDDDED